MKRVGGLFEQIADRRTVAAAAWRAAKGKRDRAEVSAFFRQADREIDVITRDLVRGEYRFSAYRQFEVRDIKRRLIHAPPFRDRVVHHAIIAVTGAIFERGAIRHSYACRAGHGQHACLDTVRSWLRRDDWFLKVDVEKFYDSISHERLMASLGRRFSEQRLLCLFHRLLTSYSTSSGRGLPIGALTSQYLGNFFLDGADRFVKQGLTVRRYTRYMDDMLLIGEQSQLRAALAKLEAYLRLLGLGVKGGGVLNHGRLGVPWLGMVVYPVRVRLGAGGRRRLRGKFRAVESAYAEGEVGERERQAYASSLFAHASHGDDLALRNHLCDRYTIRDTSGPAARDARRLVEQRLQEVPLRLSQQEEPWQPQPEPGLPPHACPRSGGSEPQKPPEDACSRAPLSGGDKTTGKPAPTAESQPWMGKAKGGGAAPTFTEGGKTDA